MFMKSEFRYENRPKKDEGQDIKDDYRSERKHRRQNKKQSETATKEQREQPDDNHATHSQLYKAQLE